jgi:hypothetical protein
MTRPLADPQCRRGPGLGRRLLLLLLCVAGGLGVAVAGHHLSGAPEWFLALPLSIAAGWFAVADPSACMSSPSPQDRKGQSDRGPDGGPDRGPDEGPDEERGGA